MDRPNCPALIGKPIGCRTCIWTGGGPGPICTKMQMVWERRQKKGETMSENRANYDTGEEAENWPEMIIWVKPELPPTQLYYCYHCGEYSAVAYRQTRKPDIVMCQCRNCNGIFAEYAGEARND